MTSPSYLPRVFNFAPCQAGCEHLSGRHLVIRDKFVRNLERSDRDPADTDTVAISYTWGRYPWRCENNKVRWGQWIMGHMAGSDQMVTMRLGEEWQNQADGSCSFADALQCICKDGAYCWIDQLSIPQEPAAEVEEALDNIPSVYKGLDVVIVLPGARCECVVQLAVGDAASPPVTPENLAESRTEARASPKTVQLGFCYNNLGFAYYFQRLWTRQELHYAATVRVVWASEDVLGCDSWPQLPKGKRSWASSAKSLGKIGKAVAISSMEAGSSHDDLFDSFSALMASFPSPDPSTLRSRLHPLAWRRWEESTGKNWGFFWVMAPQAWFSMSYVVLPSFSSWAFDFFGSGSEVPKSFLADLLNGRRFSKTRPCASDDRSKLLDFLSSLSGLGDISRGCTKPGDLIRAVWADCPGYQAPRRDDFKNMTLVELLEDAISQLKSRWGIALVTSAPSGLLDEDAENPLVWRPSLCLGPGDENKSTVVYIACQSVGPKVFAVTQKPVLRIPAKSRSTRAGIWLVQNSHNISKGIAESMGGALQNWVSGAKMRMFRFLSRRNPDWRVPESEEIDLRRFLATIAEDFVRQDPLTYLHVSSIAFNLHYEEWAVRSRAGPIFSAASRLTESLVKGYAKVSSSATLLDRVCQAHTPNSSFHTSPVIGCQGPMRRLLPTARFPWSFLRSGLLFAR